MAENNTNSSTDPLPQPSADERLSRIEVAVGELLAGQKRIISELGWIREDAKQRYADLRERVNLNNDKLSVIMRELNQIDRDLRNPKFTTVDTR